MKEYTRTSTLLSPNKQLANSLNTPIELNCKEELNKYSKKCISNTTELENNIKQCESSITPIKRPNTQLNSSRIMLNFSNKITPTRTKLIQGLVNRFESISTTHENLMKLKSPKLNDIKSQILQSKTKEAQLMHSLIQYRKEDNRYIEKVRKVVYKKLIVHDDKGNVIKTPSISNYIDKKFKREKDNKPILKSFYRLNKAPIQKTRSSCKDIKTIINVCNDCNKELNKSLKLFKSNSKKLKKTLISMKRKLNGLEAKSFKYNKILKNKKCFIYGLSGKGRYLHTGKNGRVKDKLKEYDCILENHNIKTLKHYL